MSRDLTASVVTEVDKSQVTPVMFVKLEFDSGDVLLWSGNRSITWDSQTWLGAGDLGKISQIDETTDIQATGITLELSGIPSANIALALTENYQGRPVTIWLGFMDGESVIADPIKTFSGRMDIMEIVEGAETSSISISAENRLVDLLKPREWRYTHEDQQILYPGDLGLEFVSALQEKEIVWGPS